MVNGNSITWASRIDLADREPRGRRLTARFGDLDGHDCLIDF